MYQNLTSKLEALSNDISLTPVEKNKLLQFIASLTAFISNLFKKGTVITVPIHDKDFTINGVNVMELLQPVFIREAEKGNPAPTIENNIWNYFPNITIPKMFRKLTLAIYHFTQSLTHRQILAEGNAKQIKHVGTYIEALQAMITAILAGEVDEKGKWVIFYFDITVNGNVLSYRFGAGRGSNNCLRCRVSRVDLSLGCDLDCAVCFRN